MTELSRSLLAAAREGLAPDDAVAARVRAKVAAAIAASAATATVTSTPAAAATKAAASSSLLLKLGAALVLVAFASTALVVAGRERTAEAPWVSAPPADDDHAPAHVHISAADDPLVLPDEPPRAARAKQAAPALLDTAPSEAPPPRPAALPSREPASLSREVELIDLAMVSLRKNAPLAAIEAIRVFERETFGHGQMAEEAAAIEIEARCVLREDIAAALVRFDREWPESAQRDRIQTACFSGSKR